MRLSGDRPNVIAPVDLTELRAEEGRINPYGAERPGNRCLQGNSRRPRDEASHNHDKLPVQAP